MPGARRWRQVWSDHRMKHLPPHEVMQAARTKPERNTDAPVLVSI
jgi:tRNA-dihydrouridine synthase A